MIAAALLACAVNVAPVTLEAVMRVESGGSPLAINVNHLAGPQPSPATLAEAVAIAQTYVARGYSVDLGLMQVNSRNLAALGTTIEQVLDPCANVKAGACDPDRKLRRSGALVGGRAGGIAGRPERLQHRQLLSGFRERLRGQVLWAGRRPRPRRRRAACGSDGRSREARSPTPAA